MPEKMIRLYTQAEARYTPLSDTAGQACANCRWFDAHQGYSGFCHLIENYPDDIVATGWCFQWEVRPAMTPAEPDPIPVAIVDDAQRGHEPHDHGDTGEGYIAPRAAPLDRFKHALSGALKPGQTVLKAADGQRLLFMVTSNSYRDRENETILSDALRAYVDQSWTDDGRFIGEQAHYIWHAKELGSMSDLLYADLWGPFLIEIWKERRTPIARAFYNDLETSPVEWGASHGFKYLISDRDGAGHYHAIRKYESTSLPLDAAANLLTFSGVIKQMGKREDYLKKLFEEQLGVDIDPARVQGGFSAIAQQLAEAGVQHKAQGDQPAAGLSPDVANLVTKMAEDLGDLVAEVDTLKQAQADKASDTALVDLTGTVNALADMLKGVEQQQTAILEALKQRPRASANEETVVESVGDKSAEDIQKEMSPGDPFWVGADPTED